MGAMPAFSWVLTGIFAVTGVWFLARAVRLSAPVPSRVSVSCEIAESEGVSELNDSGPNGIERVCLLAHVAMSAGMIAMSWQWGMAVPAWPQVILFAAATVWFLLLAVRHTSGQHRSAAREHRHETGTLARLHHAVMMACMVWMLIPMVTMSMSSSGHAGHGSSSMSMSLVMPTPSPTVNIVMAAALFVSAVAWGVTAATKRPLANGHSGQTLGVAKRVIIGDTACHGGMSIGMGAMLLMAL